LHNSTYYFACAVYDQSKAASSFRQWSPMLTAQEFAALIPQVRPSLLSLAAQRFGARSDDDAEDLVQETCLRALNHLADFRETTSQVSVLSWLTHLMSRIRSAERKQSAHRPILVELMEARNVVAPPIVMGQRPLPDCLTDHEKALVQAWLDGYNQEEIAQGFRVHRNTVGNRLELAYEKLRKRLPREEELTYSFWLISECSKVTVYHKPVGVWPNWFRSGPSIARIGGPARRRPIR